MNEWESLTAEIATGLQVGHRSYDTYVTAMNPLMAGHRQLRPNHREHCWEVPLGTMIDGCLSLSLLGQFILTDQFGQLCSLT